jgi:hypothetical protein
MPLRTISAGLVCDRDSDPAIALRYALELAGCAQAHLSVLLRVAPQIVPTPGYAVHSGAAQMLVMLEQEDADQRGRAQQTAAKIQIEAQRLGATTTVKILSAT